MKISILIPEKCDGMAHFGKPYLVGPTHTESGDPEIQISLNIDTYHTLLGHGDKISKEDSDKMSKFEYLEQTQQARILSYAKKLAREKIRNKFKIVSNKIEVQEAYKIAGMHAWTVTNIHIPLRKLKQKL